MTLRSRLHPLLGSIALLAAGLLPASAEVDYATQIRPIFQGKCIKCHGPEKVKGDYRLDTRGAALKAGNIVPGNPGASYLIEVVEDGEMPPKGPPLTAGEIALLKRWITEGAKWKRAVAKADPPKPPTGRDTPPKTTDPAAEPTATAPPHPGHPLPDLSKLPPALATTRRIDFATEIRPVLERSCMKCHGPERPKGRFRLDNRQSALKGGAGGPAILPGNSAASPLIHFTAHLVEDMKMPPPGDAPPVSQEEIALLRTWIDQGAPWDMEGGQEDGFSLVAVPVIGWYAVDGNEHLFREHHWTTDGFSGGFADLQFSKWLDHETRLTAGARVATPQDVDFNLELARQDVGFIRAGFEHHRRWSNTIGGYHEPFAAGGTPSFSLDGDPHLDHGRIWTEVGIDRPRFPLIVLGYEYRFKDGDKSTLRWGPSFQANELRNIIPGYKTIDEDVHRITLDLRYDWNGLVIENNTLAEFYDSEITRTEVSPNNFAAGPDTWTTITETSDTFQFANSFSLQKLVRDWWLVSAGYYYSKLDSDATFQQQTLDSLGNATFGQFWSAQPIVLDWNTHIFNASTRFGPWKDWTVTAGVQNNWERQEAMGQASLFIGLPTPDVAPPAFFTSTVSSDKETVSMREHATVRYTGLPRTVLYAEAEWEQTDTELYELDPGLINGFRRDTDSESRDQEYSLGMTLNPLPRVSIHARYSYELEEDDFDHEIDEGSFASPGDGYSAFITGREEESHAFKTHLNYRPKPWLQALLSFQHQSTDFTTETDAVNFGIPSDTPGGSILAGEYDANIYGLNLVLTPTDRLALSCTCSYQDTRTSTAANDDPAVTSYSGDVYSAMVGGTYRLSDRTQLAAYYTWSRGDYAHDNSANGLPLGIDYEMHGVQAAVSTRLTDDIVTQLQYRYHEYDEPSAGGSNDYSAHGVFLNCVVNWN